MRSISFLLLLFPLIIFAEDNITITSDRAEMNTVSNTFTLYDNVHIESPDFNADCQKLEVFSNPSSSSSTPQVTALDSVRKIIASGNVQMVHEGRTVTAGLATIFPQEGGKIILEDNPVVTDENGAVTGHRIILYRGDRIAHVEGGPEQRPTITLTNLPSFKDKS